MNNILKGFGGGHPEVDDKLYDTSSNNGNTAQNANSTSIDQELNQQPQAKEQHVTFGNKNTISPDAEQVNQQETQPDMEEQTTQRQSSGIMKHVGVLRRLVRDGGSSAEDRKMR